MNTQLAITSKVQPKPTRAEIVDALTQLEVQRRNDKSKADAARKKKLGEELEAEFVTHVIANIKAFKADLHFGYWNCEKPFGFEVQIAADGVASSPKFAKRLKEYHSLPDRPREYRFNDVRKEVLNATQGMSKDERVVRLLNDKDSRASLEKMLDALSGE